MSTSQPYQASSPTPTAYAPPQASQPSWTPSASAAASMQPPASMQPGAPAPAAPMAPSWDSGQAQPWQAAFSQLVGAPTSMPQSQDWAAPSFSTPSGLTQAQAGNWGQAPQAFVAPQAMPSAAPTYSPQPTPVFSQPAQWAPPYLPAQAPAPAAEESADTFLANISGESLEVLSQFGSEAPAKLNRYAVQVEDALLESLGHQQRQADVIAEQQDYIERVQTVLAAASADREAMMKILTDPEVLSDYTWKFFSEDGPCPVRTPAEEAQAALREGMEMQASGSLIPRSRDPQMDAAEQMTPEQRQQMAAAMERQQGQPFQRPQMSMPNPGGARMAGGRNVFEHVSQLMDVKPEDAWKVLSGADPDEVRRKVFFMEG